MNYFISFNPIADVNYIYIFSLYKIATYNINSGLYNIINYISIKDLSSKLSISQSTTNRLLLNTNYSDFFNVYKEEKIILLHNDFRDTSKPFVVLNNKEISFLINHNDNLLCKYYIYLKYYCGFYKGQQDFTAKQFLSTFGYSTNSNQYLSKLSQYNNILTSYGLIKISHYRDSQGHLRNCYCIT